MPRFRPRAQTVWEVFAVGLVLAFPLAIVLADLSGVGHRWFDLAAQFSAPATVAALAVTLVFVALRRRAAILAGTLVAALCAVAAAPQAFPETRPAAADSPTVRLYSANLHVRNDDVVAIGRSIDEARADVVILIETSDAAYAALDDLLDAFPHRTASPRIDWLGRGARTVIASRWPLTPLREEAGLHAQTTVVRSPLGPLRLTGAHLTRPWPYQIQWEQIRQTEALARAVTVDPETSRVVAGDFNSVTDARIGRLFAERSGLTPAPAFPGTWPARLPAALGLGIDNVWVSRDLTVIERRIGARNGSDHRPVVTVLTRARD
ncbi:endonuclease/exonuclease/phosphatase family protein [Brevundimonas sp.]|jgi:endonuclease/exonuclease/phosphatase (EEP) superfamily protein YafD|uniref:endonuclease/exonuclease/phosphatase family protein n=1 Tax=Brevundimonas sp. TaxID=1871086 RepID=UPI002E0DEE2D|nr:endonuclease/exonuclease/phosphatase family protein [Brevundimonas sp.]